MGHEQTNRRTNTAKRNKLCNEQEFVFRVYSEWKEFENKFKGECHLCDLPILIGELMLWHCKTKQRKHSVC